MGGEKEVSVSTCFDQHIAANNLPPLWTTIRNLIELLCRIEFDEDATVLLGAQDAAVGASKLFGEGERRLIDARNELGKRLGPDAFAAGSDIREFKTDRANIAHGRQVADIR